MRTKHAEALFLLLGVASVVTAVVMTVGSMLSVPERERHLDQLLTTLDDLARIRASLVDDEAAILRYEHLPETRPTDLAALAGRTAPGVAVDIQRREHKELGQGWVRNRMHVVFNQIALPDLGRFIDSAEQQRPPWRLVECQIKAHPSVEGAAVATLLVEGVQQ